MKSTEYAGYVNAVLGRPLKMPDFSTQDNAEYREGYAHGIRDMELLRSGDLELFKLVQNLEIEYNHHESDLYIPVNELTEHITQQGQQYRRWYVTRFKSNIDGLMWFDIAFAYPVHPRNMIKRVVETSKQNRD